MEIGQSLFIFPEERLHIDDKILYDRKMVQGTDRHFLPFEIGQNRFAGQGFPAVDHHAAGAAHADAAGVAEGKGQILGFLQADQHIENGGQAFIVGLQLKAVKMTRTARGRVIAEYLDDSCFRRMICHGSIAPL